MGVALLLAVPIRAQLHDRIVEVNADAPVRLVPPFDLTAAHAAAAAADVPWISQSADLNRPPVTVVCRLVDLPSGERESYAKHAITTRSRSLIRTLRAGFSAPLNLQSVSRLTSAAPDRARRAGGPATQSRARRTNVAFTTRTAVRLPALAGAG